MDKIHRRDFLKGAAATGLSLLLPWHLIGCSDGESADDNGEVKKRVIHFNLSKCDIKEKYTLHAAGRQYTLKVHTDETRNKLLVPHLAGAVGGNSNVLGATPDPTTTTHYVENVPIPLNPTMFWVTGTTNESGRGSHTLASCVISVPDSSMQNAAKLRTIINPASSSSSPPNGRCARRSSAYLDSPSQCVQYVENDQWLFVDAFDTACALVYHHPELRSHNSDNGAYILQLIEDSVDVCVLANIIFEQGPGFEQGDGDDGWSVLVPVTNDDGSPALDPLGNQIFDYQFSETTLDYLGAAVKGVLQAMHDDMSLQDKAWNVQPGATAVADKAISAKSMTNLEQTPAYTTCLTQAVGTCDCGLEYDTFEDQSTAPDQRAFTIGLKNHYMRYLSCYVRFLDADGNDVTPVWAGTTPEQFDDTSMTNSALLKAGLQTASCRFLGTVPPIPELMGVRLDPYYAPFTVQIPKNAVTVKILCGGIGTGTEHEWPAEIFGIILTAVVNYTIPTYFLIAGAGESENKSLIDLLKSDKGLILAIVMTFKDVVSGAGGQGLVTDFAGLAIKLANIIGRYLLKEGLAKLWSWLVLTLAQREATGAIPFAGWGLRAFNVACTVADLAETTVEVCKSPWIIKNEITYNMAINFQANPDTQDTVLPQTAKYYRIIAMFSNRTFQDTGKVVLPNWPNPTASISHSFPNVPSGGKVNIVATFLSDNDWLCGMGATGLIDNVAAAGSSSLDVSLNITEFKVPIQADTIYRHQSKLGYSGGAYKWIKSPDAPPTAVINNMTCQQNSLCEVNGIAFSELAGMIGYSFKGGGADIPNCITGVKGGQYNRVQNIGLADPNVGLKTTCGCMEKTPVVYQLIGPPKGLNVGNGLNFCLIPDANGAHHLRRIVLDAATPIAPKGSSWGSFPMKIDAMALHPAGRVAGINYAADKLMIVALPASAPATDDLAPVARALSGSGSRPGLIKQPVALGVTADGRILVLDSGNARVQAFDIFGNPVYCFANGTSPFMPLKKETGSLLATYLDMSVEAEGYIYILSHTGGGSLPADYHMDIYSPQGTWVVRTNNVAAGNLTVDFWRTMYTLNYETIAGPNGRGEPSVSVWAPRAPNS